MPTIAASISPKLFELETSYLVSCFYLPLLFDYKVLHTIVYCDAVRSAILSTAWLLVVTVSSAGAALWAAYF